MFFPGLSRCISYWKWGCSSNRYLRKNQRVPWISCMNWGRYYTTPPKMLARHHQEWSWSTLAHYIDPMDKLPNFFPGFSVWIPKESLKIWEQYGKLTIRGSHSWGSLESPLKFLPQQRFHFAFCWLDSPRDLSEPFPRPLFPGKKGTGLSSDQFTVGFG